MSYFTIPGDLAQMLERELAAEVFGCLVRVENLNVVAVNVGVCDGPSLSSGEAGKDFGFVSLAR